jgi:predicted DNA-binding transcriptional regulator
MFTSANNDRIILNALVSLFAKNRVPATQLNTGYASLNQLKYETGLSKSYIINRINSLIAKGYLSKESDIAEHGGYLTNFFTILKPVIPLTDIEKEQLTLLKNQKQIKRSTQLDSA